MGVGDIGGHWGDIGTGQWDMEGMAMGTLGPWGSLRTWDGCWGHWGTLGFGDIGVTLGLGGH